MKFSFLRYFAVVFFCLVIVACKPAPEPEKPKGILRIATVPVDMPITVNGLPKGNSPSGEGQYFSITLEEGEHIIEILKSVDDEKEQYAKKKIFVAADTVPIVTLEAEDRLTPFGETEKQRRDAEKAERERLLAERKEKEAQIGKVKWSRTFGGSSYENARDVVVDSSNNIWMAGSTGTYGAGSSDIYLVKTDGTGNKLFSKTYGTAKSESGYGIAVANDGSALVVGEHTDKYKNYNIFAIKVSPNGKKLWERSYGGRKSDAPRAVITSYDKGFIIAGYSDNGYNGYIIKVDQSGNLLWEKEKRYSKTESDSFSDLIALPDGGALLGGSYSPNPSGETYQSDIFLIRIDRNGKQKWSRVYGRNKTEYLHALKYTVDEGVLLAGETKSRGAGSSDMYLIKLDNVLPEGVSP